MQATVANMHHRACSVWGSHAMLTSGDNTVAMVGLYEIADLKRL